MTLFRMAFTVIIVLFGAGVIAGHSFGYRLNMTQSLPLGLYRYVQVLPDAIQRGDVVFACPENNTFQQQARDRGYLPFGVGCPHWFAPFLKKAMALPGDVVDVTENGIVINDVSVVNSSRLSVDGQNRAMPPVPKSGVVSEGHVWLLSDFTMRSWDSRYFGSVPLETIQGIATPIWTLTSD